MWSGGLDVDSDGNFLYVGGGMHRQSPTSPSAAAGVGRKGASKASMGWLLCAHIGTGGGACLPVHSTEAPSPVQEVQLRGGDLLTGGTEAVLRQWHAAALGECWRERSIP